MKRIVGWVFTSILVIFLIACGTTGAKEDISSADIVGFIMDKAEDRILVVATEVIDYSATGGMSNYTPAIWISNVSEETMVGQRIAVWIDGEILESYPAQGKAKKAVIIKSEQPKDSEITEAEAIQRAIEQMKMKDEFGTNIIKKIEFDEATQTWHIDINEESFEIKGN